MVFVISVFGAIAAERTAAWWRRRHIDSTEVATSMVSGAAFLLAKTLVARIAFLALSLEVYDRYRLFELDLTNPIVWVFMFVLRDLVYYWVHRAEHRVSILWASHMVHHSPETMGFTNAVRVPWMEAVYKPWLGLWVPFIGFNPLAFVALDIASATYAQLYHTTAVRRHRLLDWFIVTPSTHRVHHGSNREYIDKNFSAVFIIWDRLFGTYEPEVAAVRFGLTGDKSIDSPVDALVGGYPALFETVRHQESIAAGVRVALAPPV
jgi:sterol desaturase/sphingolipid hydroxylase (fatty acid hydroxylase superfamily)